jgi:hypothetical protein
MRLTIAIPTLNRDYCLERVVNSALAQTSPSVEVIVSNNGSTDRTREILDRYRDPRLRVFHHPTTLAPAVHANFVINEVHGELVVGLSDDDYLEPDFAARILALFTRHPELSFAYTRCWTHIRDAMLPSPAGPEIEDTIPFFQNYFSGQRHLFWCACVTRTAALRRLFPLPSDVQIGDMYVWTQLAFDGPVGCVPELLAHYTYFVDNVSLGIPVCAWAEETRRLINRITERVQGRQESQSEVALLQQRMWQYLARTTANQFALNASRGASKASLVQALRSCGRHLMADPLVAVPRVLASLALPSAMVKRLTLYFAASRSRWARSTNASGPAKTGAASGPRARAS